MCYIRKTKIICTLGPSVNDYDTLKQLMISGMNVARLNFSHGTHKEHQKIIDLFKKVREELGMSVPLLLDTKGPEIRIGEFEEGKIFLKEGEHFVFTNKNVVGSRQKASVTYEGLYKDVKKGDRILVNDGLVEMEVLNIDQEDIHCKVLNGGEIGNHKGMNIPNIPINLPSLTPQDVLDIQFGVENEFDLIAASFVRKPMDIISIRKTLEECGGSDIKIIAKIENREGVKNVDEILKVADGVMVARGDLGVEIPVEEVPIVQKMIIEKCYKNGKPVITATQMLDSMIRNPRPTRAEASDVANAIYDGTSAIMLSGETAMGKYPVESLKTMSKIAIAAETAINYWGRFSKMLYNTISNVTNAISHATCTTALDLKATAIITVTHSGNTARMISRFRPQCPIIAATVNPRVQRQLSLSWGVIPFLVPTVTSTDEMFDIGVNKALESGVAKNGDIVVITAGVPVGVSGTTNILKVHVVGKVLVRGIGVSGGCITGEICMAKTADEALLKFRDGNILVVPYANHYILPIMKRASALVVEEAGEDSYAAIVGQALEIPVVIGTESATQILKDGSVVTVDGDNGIIHYEGT